MTYILEIVMMCMSSAHGWYSILQSHQGLSNVPEMFLFVFRVKSEIDLQFVIGIPNLRKTTSKRFLFSDFVVAHEVIHNITSTGAYK